MSIIQRSPDFALNIRLQRLPEVQPQVVPKPLQPPVVEPKPPGWWGWQDADGKNETRLSVRWNEAAGPDYPYGYWPGLWVAVVEGATEVKWDVQFIPRIWFQSYDDPKIEIAWTGDPVRLEFPLDLPDTPETLFTPPRVPLPDPLRLGGTDSSPYSYWTGAYYTPGFPNVPMPSVIAAGNALSVGQDTKAMSGTIVADASVSGRKIGSVTLELMRVVHQTWS